MVDDFTSFKEEVKSRVDIVDVIGEFVELKKKGSSYLGLCPFHTEKTPSFNVNRARQFYHCFGCGKGGDVIGFLMDITGMSFLEAMEQLADRTGMRMPERRKTDVSRKAEIDRIMAANLAAAEYFHRALSESQGEKGNDYLLGRGLTPETIRAYRLGYAPVDSTGLITFARKKSVEPDALEAAGITMQNSYGKAPYNRFGGRVIFPIIDWAARIIGFGGRILEGEGAKYVNSPESPVYHKSLVLYGIFQAKEAIKRSRTAIVVEGYMDALAMHQAGINNVIASSGTSFTVEQGRILTWMANSVILLFDGDSAGISAAARGADNLLATDLGIGVIVLPEGHDPDSFIQERGPDELRKLLENPVDIWEFKLQALRRDSIDVNDITKIAAEVADSISLITDELKRDVYIRDMSMKLRIDIDAMRKAVNGRIRRRMKRRDSEPENAALPGFSALDREFYSSILNYPALARRFMEEAGLKAFTDTTMQKIMHELYHRLVEGLDISPSGLMTAFDDRKIQEIIASLSVVQPDRKRAEKNVNDYIRNSKIAEISKEIKEIDRLSKEESDREKKSEIAAKIQQLYKQLEALKYKDKK